MNGIVTPNDIKSTNRRYKFTGGKEQTDDTNDNQSYLVNNKTHDHDRSGVGSFHSLLFHRVYLHDLPATRAWRHRAIKCPNHRRC